LLAERAFAACAKRAYTGAMRMARKIRYGLEWLALKSATKFLPLLSRKACYRLALCSVRSAPCSIVKAGALRWLISAKIPCSFAHWIDNQTS